MDLYLMALSLIWLFILACILDDAAEKRRRKRPWNGQTRFGRLFASYKVKFELPKIKSFDLIAY